MTKRKASVEGESQDEAQDESQNEPTYNFAIMADKTAIDGDVYDKGATVALTAAQAAKLRRGGVRLDCDAEAEAAVQVAVDALGNA